MECSACKAHAKRINTLTLMLEEKPNNIAIKCELGREKNSYRRHLNQHNVTYGKFNPYI